MRSNYSQGNLGWMRSYKGRSIDPTRPVFLYRNLNSKERLYSMKQKHLVVGYLQVGDCFTLTSTLVRKYGRMLMLAGERCVHAFLVIQPVEDCRCDMEAMYVRYDAHNGFHVYTEEDMAILPIADFLGRNFKITDRGIQLMIPINK